MYWLDSTYEAVSRFMDMGGNVLWLIAILLFVMWALKDPNSGNLDRMQVIKGWYDNGYPREKIYDVAWSDKRKVDPATGKLPPVGNTVDPKTATYKNDIGDSHCRTSP